MSLPYNPHCWHLLDKNGPWNCSTSIQLTENSRTSQQKTIMGPPNTLLIVVQKHFCLSFLRIPFLWGAAWKANCQVIGFFLSLFSLRKCAKLSFKGAASMPFLLPKSSVQTHNLFIQAEIYNQTFSVLPSDSVFPATSEVNS